MPSPETEARELALEALGRKERTESELAEWLRERGVEADEVVATVARLVEAGVLDDERFARGYAADKRALRGWGPDRIREALRWRGVGEELIERAIACESAGDQVERAAGLLAARGLMCESEAERDRALRLLARQGFPLEVGYDAVRARERETADSEAA